MIDYHALLQNPVFAGFSGAAAFSWILYQAKAIPQKIWGSLKRHFTVTLVLYNDNYKWEFVNSYIATLHTAASIRTLSMDNWWQLLPGIGKHYYWFNRRPFSVRRSRLESQKSQGPTEQLELTFFGRKITSIEQLVQAIINSKIETPKQEIYIFDGQWLRLSSRKLKDINSVVLTDKLKENILEDCEFFLSKQQYYINQGLTYKRCYMFSGPPGTGKTSMVLAMASKIKKSIAILNIKDIDSDAKLAAAVNNNGIGITLIEDIDRIDIALKPEFKEEVPETGGGLRQGNVTLSGLLNCLDGITCPEGHLFIITTNHPEKLIPALTRPGRVDYIANFKPFTPKEQVIYLKRFYDTEDDISVDKLPDSIIPADLQSIVIANSLENTLLILQNRKEKND